MKRLVLIGAAAVVVVCSGTFVFAEERAGANGLPSFMEIFSSLNEDENHGKIGDIGIEDLFIVVDTPKGIDFKNKNFDALTEYFDKNVKGFDRDTWKMVMASKYINDTDDYQVMYTLYYRGYETRYTLLAYLNPEKLMYSRHFDGFDMERASNISDSSDITEGQIRTAKEKAVANYGEYAVLEQDVTLVLNKNYKRVIEVSTIFTPKDENGNPNEGDYKFKEIYLYFVDEGYGEEYNGTNY